jgi:hypothetical protein
MSMKPGATTRAVASIVPRCLHIVDVAAQHAEPVALDRDRGAVPGLPEPSTTVPPRISRSIIAGPDVANRSELSCLLEPVRRCDGRRVGDVPALAR